MLFLGIGIANQNVIASPIVDDNILRSRTAFAAVDLKIEKSLDFGRLSEQDFLKLRGPVLLKIRTTIHYRLREEFGSILNTVDFGIQSVSGSSQNKSSLLDETPKLHEMASTIIDDFINEAGISVIIMSDGPIGLNEVNILEGLQCNVRYTYDSINGACISVPIKHLIAFIKRPFIGEIWPDSKGKTDLVDSVRQIGADKVHTPHPTGLGVTGEGVIVGVVDGGIDSTHTEFIDRIVERRLLRLPKIVDRDHGTHVAGIIGAASDQIGITGVAPNVKLLDAELSIIRRFNNLLGEGEANYGEAMDAISWASKMNRIINAKEKADVINMSQGWNAWEYGRNGNDPMSQLVDMVVSDGIIFVKSAGNEMWRRVSGQVSPVRLNSRVYEFQIVESGEVEITLVWDTEVTDLDLVILDSTGNKQLYASRSNINPRNPRSKTWKGETVTNTYYEQVKFDGREDERYTLRVEGHNLQKAQAYEVWVSRGSVFLSPSPTGTVSVPGYSEKAITVGAVDSCNLIANFSSHGTDNTKNIKPDIVAPGVNILSTEASYIGNKYTYMNGTSMAAPHVAGVAALILDAVGKNDRGEWNFNPDDVKTAIIHGSQSINGRSSTNPDNIYGAGLVKADNIIFGGTVASNRKIRFEIAPNLQHIKAAISWENRSDNLDFVLTSADGTPILNSVQSATNFEILEGNPGTGYGNTFYLDVINRTQDPIPFTGAATHPIKPQEIEISYTTLTSHTHSILNVAFSPNPRNMLAFGSADNLIHMWDTETKSHHRPLRGHTDYVLCVAYSPDGRILASGDKNGIVRIWNAQTGSLRYTLYGHTNSVFSVAFSPDGQTVASGSLDGSIRLWDPDFGSIKKTLAGTLSRVISIAFNPIGGTLISGNYDGTMHLWHLKQEKILGSYRGHTDIVLSIDFCADGSLVASGSADGSVRVWETNTGLLQHTFTEHSDWVNSVAFNPGAGRWTLASGSTDNTIRLWDIHTDQHKTLNAHTSSVESISFSVDGSTLASGDADGKLLLWSFTPSTSVKSISVISPTNLVEDVTGDGVVNILDLARVASQFGAVGNIKEDINGDGVVDIIDLVLVANAFGNSSQSPSIYNLVNKYLNVKQVSLWLEEAEYLRNSSLEFIRGIEVLESLLGLLSPKETLLLANYPNPFNPETWIPFQLAVPAEVVLSIYGMDGKLIRTLTLGHKSEGIYWDRERAAYWDGRNNSGEIVASGIYYYTLTAGEYIHTRKMSIRK